MFYNCNSRNLTLGVEQLLLYVVAALAAESVRNLSEQLIPDSVPVEALGHPGTRQVVCRSSQAKRRRCLFRSIVQGGAFTEVNS